MHVYLVANARALQTLDLPGAIRLLEDVTHSHYNTRIPVSLPPPHRPDGTSVSCSHKFPLVHFEPEVPEPQQHPPLVIRTHVPLWNKEDFVYTDGSVITGKPTIGAGVVFPGEFTVKIDSSTLRHREAHHQ